MESTRAPNSIFNATDSVLGPEDFSFDDTVVNSKAYRRALARAQKEHRGDIGDPGLATHGVSTGTSSIPLEGGRLERERVPQSSKELLASTGSSAILRAPLTANMAEGRELPKEVRNKLARLEYMTARYQGALLALRLQLGYLLLSCSLIAMVHRIIAQLPSCPRQSGCNAAF